MKTPTEENWCQANLADQQLPRFLEKVDTEAIEALRRSDLKSALRALVAEADMSSAILNLVDTTDCTSAVIFTDP